MTAGRSNGLAATPPLPGLTVAVTGGAGYIGSILTRRLVARGYDVRVIDRLYWGEDPLVDVRDRIDLVVADIRDLPASTLDGVDAIIHLAGLSNDPTAEFDPDANWQMNALATEAIAQVAVDRGIERLVFASSCSLYDGLMPGMLDEEAPIEPHGAYAESKRYGEKCLLDRVSDRFCPVILRNGTVFGWSPRMRFDLVVNTFVKDALVNGELFLHGGGWMWRPLVDVEDVSDAMIAVMEAPAELVRGEIFNVVHSNYQIRELAMMVAGSVQLTGRTVTLRDSPPPQLVRNYECTNAKLSSRIGFVPARSVLTSVANLLEHVGNADRAELTDPRNYNIRWLELLTELRPRLDAFASVL